MVNEFRFFDPPTDALPIQIPVIAGQTIVVVLEFLNQNANQPFAPSIEIDQDGIIPGVNSVFAKPGGWLAAGPLGVTGDFGLRAIIVPEPATLTLLGLLAVSSTLRLRPDGSLSNRRGVATSRRRCA